MGHYSYLAVTLVLGFSLTVSLKRHICESSVEIHVECSLEYIQSDVRKACVRVTVKGQDHRVGANESTSQYVQLWKNTSV